MLYNLTDEDIEYIKKHYVSGDIKSILQKYPTLQSIGNNKLYRLAKLLGIKAEQKVLHKKGKAFNYNYWTEEEDNIILEYYPKIPAKDVYNMLSHRSHNSIMARAKLLKVYSYDRHYWSDDDIQFIFNNWELMPDALIAEHLNRSRASVKAKRQQLGLYRQDKNSKSYPTLAKYLRGQNQEWKNQSMAQCNYQCVLTGSKKFEIHHLYGVSNIINDILNQYPQYKLKSFKEYSQEDLDFLTIVFKNEQQKYPLGVCVDNKIHTLFHSMYGQYYNTEAQWKQFVDDYNNGNYKDYIKP